MIWVAVINYVAWFIFIFISMVWILTLLQNRENVEISSKRRRKLPSVSVLIPAYNEERNIKNTIKSIFSIDYPKHLLEIIVVNDGSTDKTKKIITQMKKQYKLKIINNHTNMGKAHSLNRALKVARGELVACMDADSIVESAIIRKMIPYLDDPKVASVTPSLKVWKTRNFLERMQHAEYILNVFLRKMLSFIDAIHVTPGVFSIYRKNVLLDIGGFDEGNLTEDMEIALKIHDAGYMIENNMHANSYTLCPRNWKDLSKQRIRWYRGALNNYSKYRHMLFNKRYGNLGMFFLPANVLAVGAIIIVFFTMALNYMGAAATSLWRGHLVGWDIMLLLGIFDIEAFTATLFSTPFLLGILGLIVGAYVLYTSFSLAEGGVKSHKPTYILYLLIFPLVMMVFWILAFIHEVAGIKKKW
ncbi:MAG: glycosyltransferase [Candidatus Aenigmatarchaeota archaeon]|nr:glycosyltransferase family 2 protein [Nanoarchaeota archaeon]